MREKTDCFFDASSTLKVVGFSALVLAICVVSSCDESGGGNPEVTDAGMQNVVSDAGRDATSEDLGSDEGTDVEPDRGLNPDAAPDAEPDRGLDPDAAPDAEPERTRLNVRRGYGGGAYSAGDRVNVWAEADSDTECFDQWQGDLDVIEGVTDSMRVIAVMPDDSEMVQLDAQFIACPAIAPDIVAHPNAAEFPNNRYAMQFPTESGPPPSGLILCLHGGGGDHSTWVEKSSEAAGFLRYALAHGYGYVCPESADRRNSWEGRFEGDVNDMVDIRLVNEVLTHIRGTGRINSNTPLFIVAASAGTNMANNLAVSDVQITAQARYIGDAREPPVLYELPTIWSFGANDMNPHDLNKTRLDNATEQSARLEALGFATDIYLNPAVPMYPEQLARIIGVSVEDAPAMLEVLVDAGIVNENFEVREPVEENNQIYQGLFEDLDLRVVGDIKIQVVQSAGGHAIMPERHRAVVQFFDATRR